METFKTQFTMSGVPTDVSVQQLDTDTYACTLNLVDFFDGGEFEGTEQGPDFTLKNINDAWQLSGESKVTLTPNDIKNLGEAINKDYLNR
jgi:hypothetical protein